MEIDNIIFDLGGVLLNIDYNLTIKAFEDLGIADFNKIYSQAHQSKLFSSFEVGEIDDSEFLEGIKELGNINSSQDEIATAWNAMLLDFPRERFDFLTKIQKQYDTFLLSNTNSIHEEAFQKIIRTENLVADLGPYFSQIYFSHRIGQRKPNRLAFEYVLNDNCLDPLKTLFIDDTMQHVAGAQKLGIRSLHLDTSVETVIDKLGFLLT
jgi:glucose-1-phosphatase